ncbi:MAG TPA: peptidoglycan-binding protein, partial [Ktedonobacteraceae bacterium]|nr:peptidoglycan-binding protein [Ktedonobacteraceae bacterium]
MTQHNNNLSLNQQGRDVALLQSRLITMGYTIATSEILSEHFGESTQRTVRHFQQAKGLPATGIVDSMTAQSIVNTFEAEKTVLMPHPLTQVPHAPPLSPPGVPPQAALPLSHLAASQPGQPPIEVVRTPTPPISTMPGNAPVIPSHPPVLQQPVPVSPPVMPPPGGEGGLPGPGPRPVDGSNSLQGAIYLEHGLPANGLAVRLYHRGFGGADALLATTQTNGQGAYTFSYNTDGQTANLDVRVVGTDGKEVSISATQYNPGQQKTLNLIAPAHVQPLSPEYERLSQALNDQL